MDLNGVADRWTVAEDFGGCRDARDWVTSFGVLVIGLTREASDPLMQLLCVVQSGIGQSTFCSSLV